MVNKCDVHPKLTSSSKYVGFFNYTFNGNQIVWEANNLVMKIVFHSCRKICTNKGMISWIVIYNSQIKSCVSQERPYFWEFYEDTCCWLCSGK